MKFSSSKDNKIKHGRVWFYLNKNYTKDIGIEWSLRFNPFNYYLCLDGGERDYTFCFWFIFVFYIKFHRIFKRYPKEWNSMTNNKKGGYLNSARRKIGISQYGWTHISLYFWHDGENSWYPKKDKKYFYKIIWLDKIFIGSHKYHHYDKFDYDDVLEMEEGPRKIHVEHWRCHKKYKRFYCKPFQYKKRWVRIKSDIEFPTKKLTDKDYEDIHKYGMALKDWEQKLKWHEGQFTITEEQNVDDAKQMYKDKILEKRNKISKNWVPSEYRNKYNRKKKLERIIDEA